MKVTVLAGGVGAARFLEGLVEVVAPDDITVISNTGDDETFFGLHVSPDIDTVIYTLAGAIDPVQGWGLADETYNALDALRRFGYETWFSLGDSDMATHAYRTRLLAEGATLSDATQRIATAFGLRLHLVPVTDDSLRTVVDTDSGPLAFQEYFVKHRTEIEVRGVRFEGSGSGRPASGVLSAIVGADVLVVAPATRS